MVTTPTHPTRVYTRPRTVVVEPVCSSRLRDLRDLAYSSERDLGVQVLLVRRDRVTQRGFIHLDGDQAVVSDIVSRIQQHYPELAVNLA